MLRLDTPPHTQTNPGHNDECIHTSAQYQLLNSVAHSMPTLMKIAIVG